MRNRYYKESKRRHTLLDTLIYEKKKGKKEIYRKLSLEDIKTIEKRFPLITAKELFIHTKFIPNYKYASNHLLKSIHYNYKNGRKILVVKYKEATVKLLDDLDIPYEIRYKISL